MHCAQCGELTPEGAAVCPFCGRRLEAPAVVVKGRLAHTMVGIPQGTPSATSPQKPAREQRQEARGEADVKRGPGGYQPADELGATVAPQLMQPDPPLKRPKVRPQNSPRVFIPPLKSPKAQRPQKPQVSRDARLMTALIAAAGVIAVAAVAFAVLWSGRRSLSARVRMDTQGREVVDVSCPSCPDGTVLAAGQASATVSGASATLALDRPLSPGENRLKIHIDRPGSDRDESVTVAANVAYRIRPDLSALQAERPAIQIVIEAAKGADVKLEGKSIPLYAGRATETFDVTDACSGLAAEATSFSRQIPYAVTTAEGEEKGSLNVTVGVVPLELEAPGPNVVIDEPSFVIAGRTLKGAELFAAGRPIPVKPDGSFAHVMNVSSVGSTQIDVRAKLAGMAPRIVRINVRRVDSLETAARDFASEGPVKLSAVAKNIAPFAGKAIVVAGKALDVQHEGRRTIAILDVGPPDGCVGCAARLVLGAELTAATGAELTAYGHVTRSVRLPDRGEIPEIQVDFVLKGLR